MDPLGRRRIIMAEVSTLADYLRGEAELTDKEIELIGEIDRSVCLAVGLDPTTSRRPSTSPSSSARDTA